MYSALVSNLYSSVMWVQEVKSYMLFNLFWLYFYIFVLYFFFFTKDSLPHVWRVCRCAKKTNNTRVWCPSLWSTFRASIETVVHACSSALCEWNQPVITEKTQQVWAAWEMKCTNYCLRVLEECTQEPKQLWGEQRRGLKAARACSVKIKTIKTPVLPVPDVYSVDNMWRQMYVDWVVGPVDKIHTSSVIGWSGNCKGAMWLVDEAAGHAVCSESQTEEQPVRFRHVNTEFTCTHKSMKMKQINTKKAIWI